MTPAGRRTPPVDLRPAAPGGPAYRAHRAGPPPIRRSSRFRPHRPTPAGRPGRGEPARGRGGSPSRRAYHRPVSIYASRWRSASSPLYAAVYQEPYGLELEPEVSAWLDTLSLIEYRTIEYHADRLAEAPATLGEPYSRHLRGAVRELRFHLERAAWRVTYWLAPQRRIVLLTVFRKTRGRETGEVQRAVAVQRVCAEEHPPATHLYDRGGAGQ